MDVVKIAILASGLFSLLTEAIIVKEGDVDGYGNGYTYGNLEKTTGAKIGKGRFFYDNIDLLGVVNNGGDNSNCCKKCQQIYWDTEMFNYGILEKTCNCAKSNKWRTGKRAATVPDTYGSFAGLCGSEQCYDRNTDYPGSDINLDKTKTKTNDKTQTAEECQHLCSKRFRCQYFTWSSTNQRCYLKSKKTGENYEYGAISGPKGCNDAVMNHTDLAVDYSDYSVVLVAGGRLNDMGRSAVSKDINSVEVFDPLRLCNAYIEVLPVDGWNAEGMSLHYLKKSGEVLFCGGKHSKKPAERSCFVLVGDKFEHHSDMVEGRYGHSGAVASDRLWMFGGSEIASISIESLVIPGRVWSKETTKMEEERKDGCAVAINNNNIILIGGQLDGNYSHKGQPDWVCQTSTSSKTCLHLIEEVANFNAETKTWTTLAPMLEETSKADERIIIKGRRRHSCVYIPSGNGGGGQVLVAGGEGPIRQLVTAQIYDIDTNKWKMAAKLNGKRMDGQMAFVDGRIFYLGGYGDGPYTRWDKLVTVEEYHPGNDTWTVLNWTLGQPRTKFAATVVPRASLGC